MNLIIGGLALGYFAIIAIIAEGKPRSPNTLKNNKSKQSKNGLKRR